MLTVAARSSALQPMLCQDPYLAGAHCVAACGVPTNVLGTAQVLQKKRLVFGDKHMARIVAAASRAHGSGGVATSTGGAGTEVRPNTLIS